MAELHIKITDNANSMLKTKQMCFKNCSIILQTCNVSLNKLLKTSFLKQAFKTSFYNKLFKPNYKQSAHWDLCASATLKCELGIVQDLCGSVQS